MFDLKREFEEQQNSSGIITYEYGLDPVNDFLLDGEIKDYEEEMNKLSALNTVDAACMAFESALLSNDDTISYESALEDFKNVISQNGFTLEDFGFASEGLSKESAILTVESAEDVSKWKKVWEWIKEKAAALWEWIKEKWNLVTGKTAKLNKIADELEKQVEAIPEGGFSKESGLTHEGASKNKLYFKDIASIPGAPMVQDVRAYGREMAKFIESNSLTATQETSAKLLQKYLSGFENGNTNYNYTNLVNDMLNLYKSSNMTDPSLKHTDYKVGVNEYFTSIFNLTPTTATYIYVKINEGEHTTFKSAVDFSGKRVANIKTNINPNKELPLLSKSEILEAIKNSKANLKYIDNLMKTIDKEISKNGAMSKEAGKFIANAPASEKNNVIDMVKYNVRSLQWFTSLGAQWHAGTESLLRILAVHTKKHYVNQH